MALNKYMHPRNIYNISPDFKKLAESFPDFYKVVKMDVTGKVSVDFKDPKCLRVLTKCLLKNDFNVDVEIPENRLVPTLPLRLNYILWIEDLLISISKTTNICGIDIGTGACAIYPLLSAVKNKWHMLGTETDEESFNKAKTNIERNNLQDFITLIKNPNSTVISYLFDEETEKIYDFCMCNPPFYSNIQEVYESRGISRPPPKNGFTGSPQELITEGGELEFIRKLIAESKNFKHKILIFTTMVGHKYNLMQLLEDLKTDDINHTHTEFCQGRVTRWGLAWTFQEYDLVKLVPPRNKIRKKSIPISYYLPELPNGPNNIEMLTKKIISIFNDLDLTYNIINKRGASITFDVKANKNTWSNQRRKRRFIKRLEEAKRKKLDVPNINTSNENVTSNAESNSDSSVQKRSDTDFEISNTCQETEQGKEGQSSDVQETPVVHAIFKIFSKNSFLLEMEHLDGTLGKEGLHQVGQYIKNNWK